MLTVQSGAEALALLEKRQVHAILCDISMPSMSGLEFMRAILAQGFDIPVAFLTGYGDMTQLIEAVHLGAVDFLQKPDRQEPHRQDPHRGGCGSKRRRDQR